MRRYLFLIISLMLNACSKTEEVIVPDNVAPPDVTISNAVYENYINRTYISILGRKPSATEFSSGLQLLKTYNLNSASRYTFLDAVFQNPGRGHNIYAKLNVNSKADAIKTARENKLI